MHSRVSFNHSRDLIVELSPPREKVIPSRLLTRGFIYWDRFGLGGVRVRSRSIE